MEVFNSHHRQGYNQPVNTQEMGLFKAVPICSRLGQSDTESEEGGNNTQAHSNLSIRPNLSLIKAQPVNLEC